MKKQLRAMIAVIAVLLALQFYFIRELLAAELLFALGFVALLVLATFAYFVGSVVDYGLYVAQMAVRAIGPSRANGGPEWSRGDASFSGGISSSRR